MKYKVQSGSMNKIVDSNNSYNAVKKALKTFSGKKLGLLVQVLKVGKPEIESEFCSTERVLREMNMWTVSK